MTYPLLTADRPRCFTLLTYGESSDTAKENLLLKNIPEATFGTEPSPTLSGAGPYFALAIYPEHPVKDFVDLSGSVLKHIENNSQKIRSWSGHFVANPDKPGVILVFRFVSSRSALPKNFVQYGLRDLVCDELLGRSA